MSTWHGDEKKRKSSGGRRIVNRKKRKFEQGTFAVETKLGEQKKKIVRERGGNLKIKILAEKQVCVTNPKTGKTEKSEVTRVIKNPANIDYDRRGVITKGAIVETLLGQARITSRAGQDGVLNAVLISSDRS